MYLYRCVMIGPGIRTQDFELSPATKWTFSWVPGPGFRDVSLPDMLDARGSYHNIFPGERGSQELLMQTPKPRAPSPCGACREMSVYLGCHRRDIGRNPQGLQCACAFPGDSAFL